MILPSITGLFQNKDKTPMVFILRPCSIKTEVKQLIVKGGGLCFQNTIKVPEEYRHGIIFLLPNGEVSWDDDTISAQYILDCAKEGKLLSREWYYCKPKSHKINEEDIGGRMPYTKTEDVNILLYVRDSVREKMPLTGNKFWKKLEKQNMFQLQGRSWHSLKDRYLKHLQGRESVYPLEGRTLGPLPKPPEPHTKPVDLQIPTIDPSENNIDKATPGSFLALVEERRNKLSPGLSQKEYHILINDFVTTMQKETKIDSKSIHKVLFKCNGNEDIARQYILHGTCLEGFYMFSDKEDKVLLKCLLNPRICDEDPANKLAEKLGEQIVADRAAALLGVSREDFEYMEQIPMKSVVNNPVP